MFEKLQVFWCIGHILIEISMMEKMRKRLFGFTEIYGSQGWEGRDVHQGTIKI
jgi:hypothetical protein